jgi:biotin synthase
LPKTETLQRESSLNCSPLTARQTGSTLPIRAWKISLSVFGRKIYTRGLIEISNYCRNDCYYCGIRRSNTKAVRYRLSLDEIYYCCDWGYGAGFRTFVLQGGEDSFFTDDLLVEIISRIKEKYSDCAITLSLGEKERASYQRLFDAGADRYLLRHETANETHYCKLHPSFLTLANRKRCLYDLKEIGFQTGCGLMVGSPFQTWEHLAEDLLFMNKSSVPTWSGSVPSSRTAKLRSGTIKQEGAEDSLFMVEAWLGLCTRESLLPATTARRDSVIRTEGAGHTCWRKCCDAQPLSA